MQKTGIEYLYYTWNPIAMRCSRVSPGCDNCWHLTTADRLCMNQTLPKDERLALAGRGPFVLRDRELSAPARVKKPSVIGVQFMGDLFHEAVPDQFRDAVYFAMHRTAMIHEHKFLILTKRPTQLVSYYERFAKQGFEFDPSVWHGLTVCNQQEADDKIPIFLQVPGKKFLSIEPMLGAIDIDDCLYRIGSETCNRGDSHRNRTCDCQFEKIDAVILGGETGPGARPLHPDWVRSVRDQCAAAGVPFFFKQWGEWAIRDSQIHGGIPSNPVIRLGENGLDTRNLENCIDAGHEVYMQRVGHNKAGRRLDGRTHDELPWRKA